MVKAQLAALARGDIFGASGFNIWSHAHGSGFGLGIHYELMRDKLRQPPYSLLLGHSEALLGAAALPKQRVQLQVGLRGASGGAGQLWVGNGFRPGCGAVGALVERTPGERLVEARALRAIWLLTAARCRRKWWCWGAARRPGRARGSCGGWGCSTTGGAGWCCCPLPGQMGLCIVHSTHRAAL